MSDTLSALKREFDLSFASPVQEKRTDSEELIGIRAGSARYAIRLSGMASLVADKRITRLPNASPELIGIAGFRGLILPVYDLRIFLGQPSAGSPRWLALVERTLAFAFDEVDGCSRVPREAILAANADDSPGGFIKDAVQMDIIRPIVDLSALVQLIQERARSSAFHKE